MRGRRTGNDTRREPYIIDTAKAQIKRTWSFLSYLCVQAFSSKPYLEKMKFVSLIHLLAFIGSGQACGGHGEEKEWSSEELAELEAKWGHEVRLTEL